MSKGLFANWRFRTRRPVLEPGQEIRVYLTAFDAETGKGQARIGDTVLAVDGASAEQLDTLIDLHVESFNAAEASGSARVR